MAERRLTPETIELLTKLRFDLTAAQGKLSEALRQLAELPLDEPGPVFSCSHCGPLPSIKSQRRLEEHLRNVHEEGLEPSRPPAKPKVETSLLDEVLPPPSVAENRD